MVAFAPGKTKLELTLADLRRWMRLLPANPPTKLQSTARHANFGPLANRSFPPRTDEPGESH
jgi:hypothetical protein